MNLDPQNRIKLPSEPDTAGETRCDYCRRQIKSASEWIRGQEHVICETCYRNFLNPGSSCCEQEIS